MIFSETPIVIRMFLVCRFDQHPGPGGGSMGSINDTYLEVPQMHILQFGIMRFQCLAQGVIQAFTGPSPSPAMKRIVSPTFTRTVASDQRVLPNPC